MFECENCNKDFDKPIYIEDEAVCPYCYSFIDYPN